MAKVHFQEKNFKQFLISQKRRDEFLWKFQFLRNFLCSTIYPKTGGTHLQKTTLWNFLILWFSGIFCRDMFSPIVGLYSTGNLEHFLKNFIKFRPERRKLWHLKVAHLRLKRRGATDKQSCQIVETHFYAKWLWFSWSAWKSALNKSFWG